MVKYLLVPGYGVAILLMLYALCESSPLHPQTPHPYKVPKLECIHGILAPFVEPSTYLPHGTTNYQRVNTQMQRHCFTPAAHEHIHM